MLIQVMITPVVRQIILCNGTISPYPFEADKYLGGDPVSVSSLPRSISMQDIPLLVRENAREEEWNVDC